MPIVIVSLTKNWIKDQISDHDRVTKDNNEKAEVEGFASNPYSFKSPLFALMCKNECTGENKRIRGDHRTNQE